MGTAILFFLNCIFNSFAEIGKFYIITSVRINSGEQK